MNGSRGNAASDAPEKPARREIVLNLTTARRMLPLVQRVVEDILLSQRDLIRLQPEQDRLDRNRRTLAWPDRQRRYQLREEIAAAERHLTDAVEELEALGLVLLDNDRGRIGFPTLVNNRAAFFSWQPGEEAVTTWHFAEETTRRPIPASWFKSEGVRVVGKN
jgi:hypothetical protein